MIFVLGRLAVLSSFRYCLAVSSHGAGGRCVLGQYSVFVVICKAAGLALGLAGNYCVFAVNPVSLLFLSFKSKQVSCTTPHFFLPSLRVSFSG